MQYFPVHHFHIPVMGLAYTIDSPIKVARFGIASVISIVEDRLVEMMRRYYYPEAGKSYTPISHHEPDYRARRITDYLNLVHAIVQQQMQKIKAEAFKQGSDIVKYFEMLPDDSPLKRLYGEMQRCADKEERKNREDFLRTQIHPGSIDVNIMTKVDRENPNQEGKALADTSDGVSALRGYAMSELSDSAVIFSAGMNPRLYSYLENLSAFDPDEHFHFRKKVIVKVSDFRSAMIQGKFLAKKGIWVSEFRIESGLNCGGHAFATEGYLMGPILEEFKLRRKELQQDIFEIYDAAIRKKLGYGFHAPIEIAITVQGGIGTYEEAKFLRDQYGVSSTGWGTPFLLVPEATTVDSHTLNLLRGAKKNDIILSNYSPLGVRFYYLKGTTSETEKAQRIAKGKPGSPCTEKHLAFNTEFTEEPICTASQKYQKLKLQHLQSLGLSSAEFEKQKANVLAKECLCVGLSNSAAIEYEQPFLKSTRAVNICPGPNIVNFSEIVSLQQMVDHIYGRTNIMNNPHRPHLFIAEMKLYLDFLKEEMMQVENTMDNKKRTYFQTFANNLAEAINYYRNLPECSGDNRQKFVLDLEQASAELSALKLKCDLEPVLEA